MICRISHRCGMTEHEMCTAGVPGSLPLLRGRRGTMCTVKGSDVRPGVPLASLGLRLFCVAGVGQCALPRCRMYTPRGSAGVPGSPPLLRGRCWTMCTVKGSDVRPGVSLASLGLRFFCVAGVGQCALSRGRMYAPGFRWRPWVSASFAWQAWDNVHCQGVPLASLGLRLFCVAGVGQCALSRGRMYAPGFRWRPWVSASFAWQVWDNVHCHTHTHTHPPTHPSHHHPSITPHHSPTITPPSLFSFLFPSCFSMLSLSLEKLITCGVIRSYNAWLHLSCRTC